MSMRMRAIGLSTHPIRKEVRYFLALHAGKHPISSVLDLVGVMVEKEGRYTDEKEKKDDANYKVRTNKEEKRYAAGKNKAQGNTKAAQLLPHECGVREYGGVGFHHGRGTKWEPTHNMPITANTNAATIEK